MTSWLAVWVLVTLAALPAFSQNLRDMQLFAPVNLSTYGGAPSPNEGYFFCFDGLMWSISKPETAPIGRRNDTGRVVWYSDDSSETSTVYNTHNNSFIRSAINGGERWDIGRICNRRGWLFSAYRANTQTQRHTVTQMNINWNETAWGDQGNHLPLQGYVDSGETQIENVPADFETTFMKNRVNTWGVELNYVYRFRRCHHGGNTELFLGARYVEFNERFIVEALGGNLADTIWRTSTDNHIVGPQIGGRWFKNHKRWVIGVEGRFLAGFNNQSLKQIGRVGSEMSPPGGVGEPLSLGPTDFNNIAYEEEFSPTGELRIHFAWRWTNNVAFRVGWSGLVIGNIARASCVNDYDLGPSSTMGLAANRNKQIVFLNGLIFGFEINR